MLNDILNDPIDEWIEIPIRKTEEWRKIDNSRIALAVYMKEGPIPHFHFRKDYKGKNDREGCLAIMEAKYFSHGVKTETLSSSQIKIIKDFLKSRYSDSSTYWDYIIKTWNSGAVDRPTAEVVPVNTPIPEYTSSMGTINDSKHKNELQGILDEEIDRGGLYD